MHHSAQVVTRGKCNGSTIVTSASRAQVVTRGKCNVNIWVARKVSTSGSINVSANESTTQVLPKDLLLLIGDGMCDIVNKPLYNQI